MRKIDKLLALLISSALILPAAGCSAGNISDAGGSLEPPVSSVSGPAEDSGTEKAAVPTEDSTAWDEEVNPKCGDYEYVKKEDGDLIIVRYTGSDSEILIPSELDGMKVTAIGSEAFAYCGSVRKLSLSEGIKEIADQAFLGCSFLESVELPGTLSDLGANPFIRCFKISEFVFPSGSD
ncbi:MAG: leucine-rich repeat domain-containing protein, partial [Clostridiales bacterium]|nr:leucine-rich repeat domain-containing protein [Clostridiales bacterium]